MCVDCRSRVAHCGGFKVGLRYSIVVSMEHTDFDLLLTWDIANCTPDVIASSFGRFLEPRRVGESARPLFMGEYQVWKAVQTLRGPLLRAACMKTQA